MCAHAHFGTYETRRIKGVMAMTWLARVLTRKSPSNSFCANNGQEFNQISVVQFDAMLMLATGAKSITAMISIMQKPTKTILKSFCQRKYVGWDNALR